MEIGKLIIIALLVYLLNIPFGYWRANVKRFSLQWILAIHIPVPVIIATRILSHLGFAWYSYVFLVSAFFLGQKTGGWVLRRVHHHCTHFSSCMVMDLYRCKRAL